MTRPSHDAQNRSPQTDGQRLHARSGTRARHGENGTNGTNSKQEMKRRMVHAEGFAATMDTTRPSAQSPPRPAKDLSSDKDVYEDNAAHGLQPPPEHGEHDRHSSGPVKYVLAGQPSGWAAMAQVVRDFDVEKINDVKEDIDTLLVFVCVQQLLRYWVLLLTL